MTYTYKTATPTATSTTTKTQINGGVDFTIPQQVTALTDFTPWIIAATPTAAQSINSDLIIESQAINVNPTRVFCPSISSGLGTSYSTAHPVLPSFKWNVPITQGTAPPLQIFNQGQVTNTGEPLVGCTVGITDQSPLEGQQSFWFKRNGVTSTGTAAATVTETTYQIAGATVIHTVYGSILPTTLTTAESSSVKVNFASPDMQTPLPVEIELQPQSAALAATNGSYINVAMPRWPVSVPVNPVCNLAPAITLQKALTVASNVVTGVGFYR